MARNLFAGQQDAFKAEVADFALRYASQVRACGFAGCCAACVEAVLAVSCSWRSTRHCQTVTGLWSECGGGVTTSPI